MKYVIGRSGKGNVVEAVAEATNKMTKAKFVFFCSNVTCFEEYTRLLKQKFSDSLVMGTSSYVELCKEGAYKDQLVVLAIEDGIECEGGVLEEIDQYPLKYANRIEKCISKLSSTKNAVCFEVTAGLINSEESVIATLNSTLEAKNIPAFGGSAGDDIKAGITKVSLNGKVYEKSCVFAIINNLGGKVKIYRENIYKPTHHYHVATKVDSDKRIVYEYDHKPAAKVMAEDLGVTMSELPKYLDQSPWGRIMGDNIYITANKEILNNQAMSYHARVYKNAQMVLLEIDDYKEINKQTLAKIKKDIPKPSLCMVVNCLARSILFENDHFINEFAKNIGNTLSDFIGFSGYGEQHGQQNFNQTMVIAVFE